MYDSYDNTSHDYQNERHRASGDLATRFSSFGRRKRKPTQIDFKGADPKRRTDRIVYAGLEPTQRGYENEKKFGHRMYKLKGYTTTVSETQISMERNQRLLRSVNSLNDRYPNCNSRNYL